MTTATDIMELWEAVSADLEHYRQVPAATYRVQLNQSFTFQDAIKQIPFLHALGISHLYASPYFRARPESMHGYDIINHNELNPAIGSDDDYAALVKTLHAHGMGQVLDIVPNHMGIGDAANQYWLDVLENGPSSAYATFFDIDWNPIKQEMSNQVLLPILGAQYGHALENQELTLTYENGAFFLCYYAMTLPLAPRTSAPILQLVLDRVLETSAPDDEHVLELQSIMTALGHLPPRTETDPERIAERYREKEIIKRRLNTLVESEPIVADAINSVVTLYNGEKGNPRSFDRLDELVRAQAYRLAYWRVAAEEINYRRFFDINELAAIRMEQLAVFEATHQLVMRLLADGSVNGLRVDHPDGLWDPAGYFRNLQRHFLLALARRHVPEDVTDEEWEEMKQEISARYDEAVAEDPHSLIARPLYVVAEKILGRGETLPNAWTIDGTSGYDFLNLVNGLFVDGANAKAFDTIYSAFIREQPRFNELILAKKRQIMLVSLVSEINVLAHQLYRIAERNRYVRDFTLNSLTFALREVIACFPIYRTYIADGVVPPGEVPYIEAAINCAKKRSPVTDPSIFDFIRDVLLLKNPSFSEEEDIRLQQDWVQKFQQVTGPVMAKGLEDTAFYIYNRLISLNEVGGEPQRFGVSVAEFHRANSERLKRWPHAMLTTSTHDTKRSEDVRARINVLSEMPKEWRAALSRWSRLNRRHKTKVDGRNAPDRNEEYLLYQTLLGAWPFEERRKAEGGRMNQQDADLHPSSFRLQPSFVERIQAYMQKALKEAKVNTSWVNPNEAWDAAARNFVARILEDTPQNQFLQDFRTFAATITHYGAFNSLAQTLLKLTAPGVPDIYQGNETWDLSLVDPDNRRPIDYAAHAKMLESLQAHSDDSRSDEAEFARNLVEHKADGCIKLYITERTLQFRREHDDLFKEGAYVPLEVVGAHSENVVAFARRLDNLEIIVAVPRIVSQLARNSDLPLGDVWDNDVLALPTAKPGAYYTNLFTGERVELSARDEQTGVRLADVFANMPVALLINDQRGSATTNV